MHQSKGRSVSHDRIDMASVNDPPTNMYLNNSTLEFRPILNGIPRPTRFSSRPNNEGLKGGEGSKV